MSAIEYQATEAFCDAADGIIEKGHGFETHLG